MGRLGPLTRGHSLHSPHCSTIRSSQVLGCEDHVDRAGGDHSHVQQRDPVKVFGHRLEVVMDYEHGSTAGTELAQDFDNRFLGDRVDALKRFVHEIDRRVLHECPREKDALLLPARELADLSVRIVRHADAAECLERGLPLGASRPAKPAELSVSAHRYHVERRRREVPIDRPALRHVRDGLVLRAIGLAVHENIAGDGCDQSEDRLDESSSGAFGQPQP